jgi:hypothetical protein
MPEQNDGPKLRSAKVLLYSPVLTWLLFALVIRIAGFQPSERAFQALLCFVLLAEGIAFGRFCSVLSHRTQERREAFAGAALSTVFGLIALVTLFASTMQSMGW